MSPEAALAREIAATGPIGIDRFMAVANEHYYASRDPLGAAGDFTTAPEISQMFGELAGLWLADMWLRAGRGGAPLYVELGPGRGTLAADALRAIDRARVAARAHLVETSPVLTARQRVAVPLAIHHGTIETLPTEGALLVVANEFFDALPIRQVVRTEPGWRERAVGHDGTRFAPVAGARDLTALVPPASRGAAVGSVVESAPAAGEIMLALARRIARQGGAALIVDYGYEGPAVGDTLQAVRGHRPSDPFADVGESDLTAHVDVAALGNAARAAGLAVHGPVGQGAFLTALGIDARAATLAAAAPAEAGAVMTAKARLTAPDQMGALFLAMAVRHPEWPVPEGFA